MDWITGDAGPRIAVVGSGAIGLFYGGKLAHAGHDVHFLMRSDLEAARARGIRIVSDDGVIALPGVQCEADASAIGPCDVVLIGLKATANDVLANAVPPLLREGTLLVTLQNGLGNEELLAERFGAARVLGGLCFICLNRIGPGVVRRYGFGRVSIGEFSGGPKARTRRLAGIMAGAGIEVDVVDDLVRERWRKLVWNVPFNGLPIVAGVETVAELLASPDLERVVRDLMREVIAAAAACGHVIPESFIGDQIARTLKMGAYRPSSVIDFRAGRPVEVEAIWGEPLRRAGRAGADVPRLRMLYALLRQLAGRGCPSL